MSVRLNGRVAKMARENAIRAMLAESAATVDCLQTPPQGLVDTEL